MTNIKRERLFVVDGNWALHKAASTLHTNRPIEDALPYHLLGIIIKDALALRAPYLCVAFDGPDVFRYKVYPGYKASRKLGKAKRKAETTKNSSASDRAVNELYSYLPCIYKLFDELGIVYYQPPTFEADDVLASVAFKYGGVHEVLIGTKDKDANQYLMPHVRLTYTYRDKDKNTKRVFITHDDVEAKFGLRADQMVDYQTLIGDKGDDVPAIKGFSPARAKKVLTEFGTLSNWYKKSTGDEKAFITSQLENLRRNRKLVHLVTNCPPPNELNEWKIPKIKPTNKWLSRTYHEFHAMCWPKSKGLFG